MTSMNYLAWWFSKCTFTLLKVDYYYYYYCLLLLGQLRSWTSLQSGRNIRPHHSTHRNPPSTQPISAVSCRSRHLPPRHACSELCLKWKRTQEWERWEQTPVNIFTLKHKLYTCMPAVIPCLHHKDPRLSKRVKCRVATDWSTGSMPSSPVHADVAR